jgi:hypothetical protein
MDYRVLGPLAVYDEERRARGYRAADEREAKLRRVVWVTSPPRISDQRCASRA